MSPHALAADGSNEEEFLKPFLDASGKLAVRYASQRGGFLITAPDDERLADFEALVPMGAGVREHSFHDEQDVCAWLHSQYLNPRGW